VKKKKREKQNMDAATAATATGRVTELRNENNALYRRKGEIEGAIQREHVLQEDADAKRKKLVEGLPGADLATEGYIHSEVDAIEECLKLSIRTADGLRGQLAQLVSEIGALEPELLQAESQVQQEQRAKAFQEFRGNLERCAEQLTQALDNSRRNFACLQLAAAEGIDKHGIDGMRICEQVFAEFYSKQFNLEARGLRRVYAGFQNTQQTGVLVQPMTGV
jgi:hypothetical protein